MNFPKRALLPDQTRTFGPCIAAIAGSHYIVFNVSMYSKIPILRPLFGLPKSGLIGEVVLISNTIS